MEGSQGDVRVDKHCNFFGRDSGCDEWMETKGVLGGRDM